jgi:hypothetical protein
MPHDQHRDHSPPTERADPSASTSALTTIVGGTAAERSAAMKASNLAASAASPLRAGNSRAQVPTAADHRKVHARQPPSSPPPAHRHPSLSFHRLLAQDARKPRGGRALQHFSNFSSSALLHARFEFVHDGFGFAAQEPHRPPDVLRVAESSGRGAAALDLAQSTGATD